MFQQILGQYFKAVEERSLDDMCKLIHDDLPLTLIMPNGKIIRGKTEFIDLHQAWFSDMDWVLENEILEVHEYERTASCLSKVLYRDLDENGNEYTLSYYLYLLFECIDSNWYLVHDQNTIIPK